jgi:hypothetical protein
VTKVIVYHRAGCDSGCCGHAIQIDDDRETFNWEHPDDGEDPRAFAERLVTEQLGAEHVADLDWENCMISTVDRC